MTPAERRMHPNRKAYRHFSLDVFHRCIHQQVRFHEPVDVLGLGLGAQHALAGRNFHAATVMANVSVTTCIECPGRSAASASLSWAGPAKPENMTARGHSYI